ncbi:MAG: porin [Gammaproteobacteria bacterium]|jgi:hypothetical protein|nr:porin [Gammaproteobacteria bacterium]
MLHKNLTKSLIASAVLTGFAGGVATTAQAADGPEWSFSGYVKLDAMISDYGDGSAGNGTDRNIGRQFYIPSLTPVGGQGDDQVTDFHARQSRFFFDVKQTLENGEAISGRIEMDFLTLPSGDERISNSYAPRLRQVYLTYKNWMIGQAWSNFQDLSILPESVDFVGATDGMVFMRQPQVRYTDGNWSVSVENPETTVSLIDPGTGAVSRQATGEGLMPDFTAKWKNKTGNLSYSVAGLVRQLAYDIDGDGSDETTAGYGITIGAKYAFDGGNDIRASFTTGKGIGRYLGLNTYNGAYVTPGNNLESLGVSGVTFAYRHHWTDTTRSNFVYSRGWADNKDNLEGSLATEFTQRIGVNVMHSVDKKLTFGGEVSLAKRENEAGQDGDLTRLQFMAMYSF